MNSSLSKKLTFLVPLKERREFTLRFFRYLVKVNFPYKIFFADGSKKRLSKNYMKILKNSKIDFTYRKFPYDSNFAKFQRKILNSLSLINTKYVFTFSDDDFPLFDSIDKHVKFLEKNKSYVACGGYAINFDMLDKPFDKDETFGHPINFKKIMTKYSNDKKNKISRFEYYLNNMENSVHYVFRKDILLRNYKLIYAKKIFFTNKSFYGFLRDGANSISGKVKKLNLLTFLHQYHFQSNIKSFLKHEQMVEKNSFIKDFKKFYNRISKTFFKTKKKKLKHIMFSNEFFFPKTKINSVLKKTKTKNFLISKLSKIKIILLFYSYFLNIRMHLQNEHIKKFMVSINDKKIKRELSFIFKFLKTNQL